MKRLLAICLCLLMLPMVALAGEKEVWTRIDELIPQQAGYTPDMYCHGNLVGDPDNGWTFSITLYDHPEDEDGLLVYLLTPEGELIHERGPYKLTVNQQAANALRECFGPGGYLKIAEVAQKWQVILSDVNVPPVEEIGHPWDEHILMLDFRSPEESTISHEEALAAAEAVLLNLPGWSEEKLAYFSVDFSACMVPQDIDRLVWLFYFDEDIGATWDDDIEVFDAALEAAQARTINGERPPVHFSVLIDAMDGSLVEAPAFDYRAPQFTWADFIARPATFLNYYHTEE